jgi:hypothetical protein
MSVRRGRAAEGLNGRTGHGFTIARLAHGPLDRPRRDGDVLERRTDEAAAGVARAGPGHEALVECLEIEPFARDHRDHFLADSSVFHAEADQPLHAHAPDLEPAVLVTRRDVQRRVQRQVQPPDPGPLVGVTPFALEDAEKVVQPRKRHDAQDRHGRAGDRLALAGDDPATDRHVLDQSQHQSVGRGGRRQIHPGHAEAVGGRDQRHRLARLGFPPRQLEVEFALRIRGAALSQGSFVPPVGTCVGPARQVEAGPDHGLAGWIQDAAAVGYRVLLLRDRAGGVWRRAPLAGRTGRPSVGLFDGVRRPAPSAPRVCRQSLTQHDACAGDHANGQQHQQHGFHLAEEHGPQPSLDQAGHRCGTQGRRRVPRSEGEGRLQGGLRQRGGRRGRGGARQEQGSQAGGGEGQAVAR